MEIAGKNALVLGGAGMVGLAVCRLLLEHEPARLVVAARHAAKAERSIELLRAEFPGTATRLVPVSGDVLLRGEWQIDGTPARGDLLADTAKRRRLIADILDPLDEDIYGSSFLVQLVTGAAPGLDGVPAGLIVDCMNTATVFGYQNVFAAAQNVAAQSADPSARDDAFIGDVEHLLAALYIPQLVRHVQLLHEATRRAGTQAYVKVGTSGTGGMGFNIPYTHGEERPSRVLLSKAALAGAHSQLLFLMARTPGGPPIVKEIKPTALIGWREIAYGPVGGGEGMPIYDCPAEQVVSVREPANLAPKGDFGTATGGHLEAVYIDTGENGRFSAAEFGAITAYGQMRLVTPEEVAANVMRELIGANTGRDIVAALDGAVTGPTYRGGLLREAALSRLRQLESEHGIAVAFELLGPPRLAKLLFEAELLRRACGTLAAVEAADAAALSAMAEKDVLEDAEFRRRAISIGIPILLGDGERMLRGPVVKSHDAFYGWIDLTPANMEVWRGRAAAIRKAIAAELDGDTSSRHDRQFAASRAWGAGEERLDIAEAAAWIFETEDQGRREL